MNDCQYCTVRVESAGVNNYTISSDLLGGVNTHANTLLVDFLFNRDNGIQDGLINLKTTLQQYGTPSPLPFFNCWA